MVHHEIISTEMKFLRLLFECFNFYASLQLLFFSCVCVSVVNLNNCIVVKMVQVVVNIVDMMLDKICDFLIGVFFFLVVSRCCTVVGEVLMHVSFNFMWPVVISWFSARHSKFSTLSPHIPQFNVSFPKNGFHTYICLGSPWINESPSNTFCIFLFVFNVDIRSWWNLCHSVLQNRPTGVEVGGRRSYILTTCGHSFVYVSIWYSSLWITNVLSCFWSIN